MDHPDDELVLLTKISEAHVARILRASLEDAGIFVHLENEHVVGTNWMWSNLVGGIGVKVPASELSRAQEIMSIPLADTPPLSDEELERQAMAAENEEV